MCSQQDFFLCLLLSVLHFRWAEARVLLSRNQTIVGGQRRDLVFPSIMILTSHAEWVQKLKLIRHNSPFPQRHCYNPSARSYSRYSDYVPCKAVFVSKQVRPQGMVRSPQDNTFLLFQFNRGTSTVRTTMVPVLYCILHQVQLGWSTSQSCPVTYD